MTYFNDIVSMNLKKSFTLTETNCDPADLDSVRKYSADIHVAISLIEASKAELSTALGKRNEIFGDILLKFGYIIKQSDKIVYNDQLKEIFVYGSNGTIDEYQTT